MPHIAPFRCNCHDKKEINLLYVDTLLIGLDQAILLIDVEVIIYPIFVEHMFFLVFVLRTTLYHVLHHLDAIVMIRKRLTYCMWTLF